MATFKLLTDSDSAPPTAPVETAFSLADAFSRRAEELIVIQYGVALHDSSYVSMWFHCLSDKKFKLFTLCFFNHKGTTYFCDSLDLPIPEQRYNPKWFGNIKYPEESAITIAVTAPLGALDTTQLEFIDAGIGLGRIVVRCRTTSLDTPCSIDIVIDTRNPLPELCCYITSDA